MNVSFSGVILAILLLAVLAIIYTASRSRKWMVEAGIKLCPGCATPHPRQAQFCRKCGKKLG